MEYFKDFIENFIDITSCLFIIILAILVYVGLLSFLGIIPFIIPMLIMHFFLETLGANACLWYSVPFVILGFCFDVALLETLGNIMENTK